jgi:hypothetical protein
MKSVVISVAIAFLAGVGCQSNSAVPPRQLQIEQTWQLQPGSSVAGYRVLSGLGDISIETEGDRIHAPFDGKVEPHQEDCVIFSSPHVPAYLLRLCGVQRPKFGEVREGEVIGQSQFLQFAVLRRQPNGQWALVEPSNRILEKTLRKP